MLKEECNKNVILGNTAFAMMSVKQQAWSDVNRASRGNAGYLIVFLDKEGKEKANEKERWTLLT